MDEAEQLVITQNDYHSLMASDTFSGLCDKMKYGPRRWELPGLTILEY